MTREAFIASPGESRATLCQSERLEVVWNRERQLGDGLAARRSEAGRKRCWLEFAGAVHAILEESPHDA